MDGHRKRSQEDAPTDAQGLRWLHGGACHKQTTVKLSGHIYQGLPLYLLVGKVDDNAATNSWGDFNVAKATRATGSTCATQSTRSA